MANVHVNAQKTETATVSTKPPWRYRPTKPPDRRELQRLPVAVSVATGLPMLMEPCARCSTQAVRILGTEALCAVCEAATLKPIRDAVVSRQGHVDFIKRNYGKVVRPADESLHGRNHVWLLCFECNGQWVGLPGDECEWCQDRYQRNVEERRANLLRPPWLNDLAPLRLDEVDQRVWNRTRGITGSNQERAAKWLQELAAGIKQGLIAHWEAEQAITWVNQRML